LRILNDKLEQAKCWPTSEQEKTALTTVQQLEQSWGKEFAALIDKRKMWTRARDCGRAADFTNLQKDASSWSRTPPTRSIWSMEKTASWSKNGASRMKNSATGPSHFVCLSTLLALGFGQRSPTGLRKE